MPQKHIGDFILPVTTIEGDMAWLLSLSLHKIESGIHFYNWVAGVPLARFELPAFTMRDECTNLFHHPLIVKWLSSNADLRSLQVMTTQ